ncbi:MAG: hypothetical protein ACI9J2_002086 [Saprospiraceae bacterium]|jgi:hypothetical protein
MKNSKLKFTILAAGLLGAAVSVQAMKITAEDVDLNADGMVTEAEIINVIKGHFMAMDADNDKMVSHEEWAGKDSNR